MTMADLQQRRRRLQGQLVLSFLLTATFLRASSIVRTLHRSSLTNAGGDGESRSRGRRRRLLSSMSSSPMPHYKRVRAHKVPTLGTTVGGDGIVDEPDHAVNDEGGEGDEGGIVARDSHDLPIEVASSESLPRSPPPPRQQQPQQSQHQHTTKIINGLPYSRPSHPYISRIHWSYPGQNSDTDATHGSFCGGSLISPDIVLTAAHCLGKYETYVDVYDVTSGRPKTHWIQKSVPHPEYDEGRFGHDIGLILIATPHLDVKTVDDERGGDRHWSLEDPSVYDWVDAPPIVRLHRYNSEGEDETSMGEASMKMVDCLSLSERESEAVTEMTVIGYGTTEFGPDGASRPSYSQLQGADVHYMLNEECNDMYLEAPRGSMPPPKVEGRVITDDMMCAMDRKEGQDACSGDSGGPLVTRLTTSDDGGSMWTQVGVVSWGIGCALSKYPGVYSRVASEIEWIEEEVCGRGKRKGGLSPLSCMENDNGEMQLRDYTMEAFVAKAVADNALDQDGGYAPSNERRGAEVVGERRNGQGELPLHNGDGARRRGKVDFAFDLKKREDEERYRLETCELLAGDALPERNTPWQTSAPTGRPTPPPTRAPRTDRPTREKRNPSDDPVPSKVPGGGGPSSSATARTCQSHVGDEDMESDFHILGSNNHRVRNCNWVRRKCGKRCANYSDCCPKTCKQKKCRRRG